MKLLNIIAIFSLLLLFSCSGTPEEKFISSKVPELKLGPEIKWLVILPNMGCTGCIQEGEAFLKETVDNPEVYFVVTQLQSIKILQQKVGRKLTGLPNVFIDLEKKFSIPGENSIYPCIIDVDKGKMTAYQFQSPSNSLAFQQLQMKTELNE